MEILPIHATLILIAGRLERDVLVDFRVVDVISSLIHPDSEASAVLAELSEEPRPVPVVQQLCLNEAFGLCVKLQHRQELPVDIV